jgi:hypothetical protein
VIVFTLPLRARRSRPLSVLGLEARITPSVDQVYDPTGANPYWGGGFSYLDPGQERAQTFQVGTTGVLTQVDVWVYRFFNDVHGDLVLDIRATQPSGAPTSTAGGQLLTTTMASTAVPVQGSGAISFDLSSFNLYVTQGEELAIVVHEAPDPNGDVTYQWSGGGSDPYPAGQSWERAIGNHDWAADPQADVDWGFRTFVNAAPDQPPAVTTDTGLKLNRGATASITRAELEATDPDNTPAELTYTVSAGPQHGTLELGGTATSTFTQDDLNNNRVTYQNDGGPATADGFTFTVSDGVLTTASATFALTVNQPPAVTTNTGLTVNQGATVPIVQADLEATDPDNSPAELTYTVSAGPGHGAILLGGNPASTFTQADINAGSVSYANDGASAAADSFTFTVSDGSLSTNSATFAITVNAVDQPPRVATNAGLVVAVGTTVGIGHAALDTVDPDTASAQLVYTVSAGPGHGTLLLAGHPAATFTQADIDAGRLGYANDGTAATADAFTFTVSDGTVATNPAAFAIAVDTPPQVTQPPADAAAFAGSPVTLSAAASGSPAPTVRWQIKLPGGSFADIPGATSPAYTFLPSAAQNGAQFQAVFTNPVGTVTSSAATLTIKPGLAILTEPMPQTVALGATATFTAGATGSTAVKAQWQVSTDGGATWSNISGATKNTLVLTKVPAALDGALYRAVFTDAAGQAASAAAKLTVDDTVTLAGKQPVAVKPGTAVTLAVQSKARPTAVQWQVSPDGKNWSDIAGATGETYTFAAQAADSGHQFRALATVGTKTAASPAAALTVLDPPTLTASPTDQTAAVGGSATFTAGAVGIGMKTQWQVSTDGGKTFTTVRGATKSTLTLKKLAAGVYIVRAVFTDAVGITQSATATLTVS